MADVRVFLLDDHEVVRTGLRQHLARAEGFTVVGDSGSAVEAAREIAALRPDVAVLDSRLADGSGISVCRDVRALDPGIRGLVLTSYDDDSALVSAVLAGASGYVLKSVRLGEVVDGIRRVAAGESLLDARLQARVRRRLQGQGGSPCDLSVLTEQERRVLWLIAEGLSDREIAGQMVLAEKTVRNYVSSLLGKLGLARRTQAAVFAARTG